MKKIIMAVACFVLLGVTEGLAQSNMEHLKGLRIPSMKESQSLDIMLDASTRIYNEKGEQLSEDKYLPLLMSNDYTMDPYVNSKGEFKLAVLRLLTDEEKKEYQAFENDMPSEDDHFSNSKSPGFTVTDLDGNVYNLSELQGKVVVLNFWFIACKPCVMEMPELNELVKHYKSKDVVFLGLSIDKKEQLQKFLNKNEFNYHIVANAKQLVKLYNVQAFPTHVVIGKDSNVSFTSAGYDTGFVEVLKSKINEALTK